MRMQVRKVRTRNTKGSGATSEVCQKDTGAGRYFEGVKSGLGRDIAGGCEEDLGGVNRYEKAAERPLESRLVVRRGNRRRQ